MCVAVVKPINGKISDEQIRNCFSRNKDGAGFSYIHKGRSVIRKGFFTVEAFIKEYREAEEKFGKKSPFLLHFRVSTGGRINAENCHPFLTDHGAMMHNGYFFHVTGDESDTHRLAKRLGGELDKDTVLGAMKQLETAFGHNKLAFLYKDRSTVIINEALGEWVDGTWYSNDSYVTPSSTGSRFGAACDVSGRSWAPDLSGFGEALDGHVSRDV